MSSLARGNKDAFRARLTAELFSEEAQLKSGDLEAAVFWRYNGDIAVLVAEPTLGSAILVRIPGVETEGNSCLTMPGFMGDV